MKKENIISLLNYYNVVLPSLTAREDEVLEAIFILGSGTDEEIAHHLNLGIQNISGRVGKLEEKKLIVCESGGRTKANNPCRISRINPNYKYETTNHQIEKFNLEPVQPVLI